MKPTNQSKATIITPTLAPEPTSNPAIGYCELNDDRFEVGETFPAADGCNTCSCEPDLTIACTEKACPATSSGQKVSPAPTKK